MGIDAIKMMIQEFFQEGTVAIVGSGTHLMQQLHDGKPALIFTYSLSAKAEKVVKGRKDITVFCHTNSNDTEVLKSTGETILSGINLWDCGMATKEKYQHLLAICYKENRDIRRRRV